MTDLGEAAEEAVLAEVTKHAENDCCHNDDWRGRFCSYHLGMRDGVEVAFALLREAVDSASRSAPS